MFKEKLREYLKIKGISQVELSNILGDSQQAISDFLSKDSNPQKKTRKKYFEKLVGFEDYYKGITSYNQNDISKTKIIKEKSNEYDLNSNPEISSNSGVPYIDVDFIGGFDVVINSQSITPTYYINYPPYNDCDYWVNVTGKSMSPFISHGDIAALKLLQGWENFWLSGEIYAIVTDEFRTIKKVKVEDGKDYVTLIPHNQSSEFQEQKLPKKLIRHVFRVKGAIKKFF